MRTTCLVVSICLAIMQWTAHAQSPAVFDVVSIKPRVGEPVYVNAADAPDRFTWQDVTLAFLIRYAWDLYDFQLTGGPDWIDAKRWDIDAKAARPVSGRERRLLVQRLLEERFALRTHVVTRELPVYELVHARRDRRLGPRIKPAAIDCRPFHSGERPGDQSPKDPVNRLITILEAALQRRVIDNTGLTEIYDIELSYVDQNFVGKGIGSDDDGPALLTAVQEQLGLRLQPSRGPVQVLVVDSVAEPTAN